MKLLINTASAFKGGSVQVAKSFLEECRKSPDHTYHVVLGPSLSNLLEKETFPANFHFYEIGYRPATRVFSFKSASTFFKELESKLNIDMVFTTSGPAYWRPQVPHLIGYNLAHYIYQDSSFLKGLPLLKRLKWKLKGEVIRYFFRRDADAYVTQTDDVNLRVRHFLKSKNVHTVSNTCSAHYFEPTVFPNKLPDKETDEFRFFTLSAWYLHKNLQVIPEVIDNLPEALRDRVRFVLTLPQKTFEVQFPDRYRENILNVGPVRIEEGPSLYRECDALFLPTLLECFSASYPEAMALDKPIVTSDLGFARSICQDAALYFDPMDPKDIARQIVALVESESLQQELVVKGKRRLHDFGTAQTRAARYLALCEGLVSGRKPL